MTAISCAALVALTSSGAGSEDRDPKRFERIDLRDLSTRRRARRPGGGARQQGEVVFDAIIGAVTNLAGGLARVYVRNPASRPGWPRATWTCVPVRLTG